MFRLAPVALVAGAFLSAATNPLVTGCVGFRPEWVVLDERIQEREPFSHGGRQRDFLGFPFRQETLIEGFDPRIEPRRDERGHVPHATDIGSASERAALARDLAGIIVQRSHAHELRNLSAIEFAQFRQLGQHRADGHPSHTLHGLHDLDFTSIGVSASTHLAKRSSIVF